MTNDEVLLSMLRAVEPLQPRHQLLSVSLGCALAQPVIASVDIPATDVSSRDGFALRTRDVNLSKANTPVRLRLADKVAAAGDAMVLAPNSAFSVLTGGRVPDGADAVVCTEDVVCEASAPDASIQVNNAVPVGQHLVRRGAEFNSGMVALPAGTTLGPPELAALAALGVSGVMVHPKPRVAIIVTGTELHAEPFCADSAKVHSSNAVLAAAMVDAVGGVVACTYIVADETSQLVEAFNQALNADLILSTGGTGQGARDLVHRVLRDREVSSLWDMKTGGSRPVAFRVLSRGSGGGLVPHLALSGRPIAASVAFALFGHSLIRHLAGLSRQLPRYAFARLRRAGLPDLSSQRFLPVRLDSTAGELVAIPTGDPSLYGLKAALGAHGFALLPRANEKADANDPVRVLLSPWAHVARCGEIFGNY